MNKTGVPAARRPYIFFNFLQLIVVFFLPPLLLFISHSLLLLFPPFLSIAPAPPCHCVVIVAVLHRFAASLSISSMVASGTFPPLPTPPHFHFILRFSSVFSSSSSPLLLPLLHLCSFLSLSDWSMPTGMVVYHTLVHWCSTTVQSMANMGLVSRFRSCASTQFHSLDNGPKNLVHKKLAILNRHCFFIKSYIF